LEGPDGGKKKPVGSVEHMRVIYAHPRHVLRMQGALGPLQSEAVLGTLTVAIEPVKDTEGRSKISFSYVVGGYNRYKNAEIANAVDRVLGEQFANLTAPYAKEAKAVEPDKEWSLDVDKVTGGGAVATQPDIGSGAAPEKSVIIDRAILPTPKKAKTTSKKTGAKTTTKKVTVTSRKPAGDSNVDPDNSR
jgi:alpha-D-ribose 1-methylphosphonate 5-triphosphate synthase subunit PhnG